MDERRNSIIAHEQAPVAAPDALLPAWKRALGWLALGLLGAGLSSMMLGAAWTFLADVDDLPLLFNAGFAMMITGTVLLIVFTLLQPGPDARVGPRRGWVSGLMDMLSHVRW